MTTDELLDALASQRGMDILRKVITNPPPAGNVVGGSVFSKLADVQADVDKIKAHLNIS